MIEGSLMHWGDKRMANIIFKNGSKEISLTIDNGSLCRTEKLHRSDMRLFRGQEDVTALVFNCGETEIVRGDIVNMAKAMNWLQVSDWDPPGV